MLIFVEGRDGSGKTTLCDTLYKRGFNTIRVARGLNKSFCELAELNGTYICDRSFITELVYRIVDNTKCDMSLETMIKLLHRGKVKIIYCCTKDDFKNSMKRGEDNITTEEASNRLALLYNHILAALVRTENIKVFEYDWHKDDINKVVQFVNNCQEVQYGV